MQWAINCVSNDKEEGAEDEDGLGLALIAGGSTECVCNDNEEAIADADGHEQALNEGGLIKLGQVEFKPEAQDPCAAIYIILRPYSGLGPKSNSKLHTDVPFSLGGEILGSLSFDKAVF